MNDAGATALARRERPPGSKKPVLDADAMAEQRKIGDREGERDLQRPEGKWKHRNFGRDNRVVGMTKKPVRPSCDQGNAGRRNDARRP